MMELHILKKTTGDTLGEFALGDASELIIGRDESCDVRIVHKSVSREHCAIESIDGELRLRDLESTGGTFLRLRAHRRSAYRGRGLRSPLAPLY